MGQQKELLVQQERTRARPPADARYAALCIAVAVLCTLATVPVLEMGVNDDWSYSLTAQELARTGHLTYNGWATAMIGAQAYWAALWIRLFGFSFTLVRLTTLPFVAGCALLLYALGRRVGLCPIFAVFATLTTLLSPVVLPLSASFMTDVPGLFFLLLALYATDRALETQASESGKSLRWLLFAVVIGLAGGTIRQVIWICPIVFPIYFAWRRRGCPRQAVAALLLCALSVVVIRGCLHWFWSQPYALRETLALSEIGLHALPPMVKPLSNMGMTVLLFLLPVSAGTWTVWRPVWKRRALVAALCAVSVVLGVWLWRHQDYLAPWIGNIVTIWGPLGHDTTIGDRPRTLRNSIRLLLSLAVYVNVAVLVLTAVQRFFGRSGPATGQQTQAIGDSGQGSGTHLFSLFLLFTIIYVPLLAIRAATQGAFDRYLIPLVSWAAFLLLRYHQDKGGVKIKTPGWVLLIVFAAYGIAATHDYLASERARLAAASRMVAAGVPRTEIFAGLEYDGWTQIQQAGYFNDPRLTNPPNAYHPRVGPPCPLAAGCNFYPQTPSISPHYFVVLSKQPELTEAGFPPVAYTAWLPPFSREVFIQKVPANMKNGSKQALNF